LVVVLPLLSSLAFSLFCTDFDDSTSTTLNIISHTNSILTSLCYSVIFLYRNDFYKPIDE
jgi:hypothetical protein